MKALKWIPKNIGAIMGIAQAVVSFVRELCMLFARIICPIIPGDEDEEIVAKIREIAEKILEFLEKIKNWLLGLGFKI